MALHHDDGPLVADGFPDAGTAATRAATVRKGNPPGYLLISPHSPCGRLISAYTLALPRATATRIIGREAVNRGEAAEGPPMDAEVECLNSKHNRSK